MPKKYYEYFNPNPEPGTGIYTKGDCSIRACCVATGKSWLEVFDDLTAMARKTFNITGETKTVAGYIESEGFTPYKVTVKKGSKRPTMKSLIKENPGKIIVGLCAHHFMCARGGKVLDVWDSSERPLYKYWMKG